MKSMNLELLAVTAVLGLLLAVSPMANAQTAAATYKAKCAMCHGADGKADTPAGKSMGAHSFSSPEVKKESDTELEAIISKGKNKMPPYASRLKESEIKELAAYVKELGNK
ncbi:MAG TPA: cytochrome c [Terriglobales bacterium]|nr:cytochrome c [Terriglobales bacterium]